MATADRALDEQVWRAPAFFDDPFWGGSMHPNNVLWYFKESPYFESMSNNNILIQQLSYNEHLKHILFNKELFEARLRGMSGLEFIVGEQPADPSPAGTGVYVIRKQMRRKRQMEEDEVIVLSTYHVVGMNIYMASVVADILGSRMLAITQRLNKFMSIAANLPDFSPSLGHRYMPPPSNRLKSADSQLAQGSKETTPPPEALTNSKKTTAATNISASNYLDVRLLQESLNITLKYGDEYMDDNPITGQPGDFHLSTTGRKERDKLMVPATTRTATPTSSAKPSVQPTSLKTDIPPARKGSKADKSPRTPVMPKPKRRKSTKAVGSGSISPT